MIESPIYGKLLYQVRYWDFAASKKKKSDFTAGVRMGMFANRTAVVLDMRHGKYSPAERDQLVLSIAQQDGYDLPIYIEQEPGSSGLDVADHYRRMLIGYTVRPERPSGSKETRAVPFATACEGGLVKVRRGPWNDRLLDELEAFPNGSHDDQVDVCAAAFNALSRTMHNSFSGYEFLASGGEGEHPGGVVPEEELSEYDSFYRELIEDNQRHRREIENDW